VVAGRLIDANLCALVRTDNEALVDSAPVLVALVSAVSIAVAHQVVLDALPVVTRELVGGAGRRSSCCDNHEKTAVECDRTSDSTAVPQEPDGNAIHGKT